MQGIDALNLHIIQGLTVCVCVGSQADVQSQTHSTRIQRLTVSNTKTMATHSRTNYTFRMALG